MLNCVFDCGYCFLQGMFPSANHVWFVNYEDCMAAIDERLSASPDAGAIWFFSGYDCDSLALDRWTGFGASFLPFFAERPRAWLELRTKSTQVESLLGHEPFENCVVAFSFTPREVHQATEVGVPTIEHRLTAMARLQAAGWQVGLRFDPLIWSPDFATRYRRLFEQVFEAVAPPAVHSVSYGSFRLPPAFHRRMVKLRPLDPLLAGPLAGESGMIGYRADLEVEMSETVTELLASWVEPDRFFPCPTGQSAITSCQ